MSFARDVAKFSAKAEVAVDKTVRAITFALFREVIQRTPVGEPSRWKHPERAPAGYVGGRLKGNWQTTVNAPASGTVETIDASGARTIASVATGMGGWGSVTYLTNNVVYAIPIEFDGHSSIAKAGMVRVSFARVPGIVRKAIRENKV